ncbi:pimeloyl-ACP methyl ester carboxylesterase [Crossiella equi]|uniref:Pimeloyl-ACP methyl ester carboxylesterase n=1 Tax=Crossiella equi TaxID=130796 RepID=A0ABS5ANI7_9PSEU|nr:alpha/beta fold hydrolase [Crossiella equi]MBP2478128.1 pimeloyl-ACP methyl ester carboxylesterase [Crossiella equi]
MATAAGSRSAAAKRRAAAEALLGQPGVASVRRPVVPGGQARFSLRYVRARPGTPDDSSATTLLVIPGGPGLASVLPFARFRAEALARGLDVVMVEHRGVGLSRTDDAGDPLPAEALTVHQVVDDLAAVLEAEGIEQAVVVGSSYGTYLAQGLGVRHPRLIAGMVLDSTMLTARDWVVRRAELRRRYWDGDDPATATSARRLRALVRTGRLDAASTGEVVQRLHENGGPLLVRRVLDRVAEGRGDRLWQWVAELGGRDEDAGVPLYFEADPVSVLAYRELGYAPEPDGLPLDVNLGLAPHARRYPRFAGEPFDLPAALPGFDWPLVVLSGEYDLRTPGVLAAQAAALAPHGVLVPLARTGHAALSTHPLALLTTAASVAAGAHHRLPALAGRLAALSRPAGSRNTELLLRARLAVTP